MQSILTSSHYPAGEAHAAAPMLFLPRPFIGLALRASPGNANLETSPVSPGFLPTLRPSPGGPVPFSTLPVASFDFSPSSGGHILVSKAVSDTHLQCMSHRICCMVSLDYVLPWYLLTSRLEGHKNMS